MITRLLVANRAEIASPGLPHLPRARHRDRGGPLRRGRRPALRRARPTSPYACRATPRPRPTCDVDLVLDAADAGRRRRDPPRLRLPVRERRLRPRGHRGAGLTWVGPTPESIDAMGSKIGAKELMAAAGVPVLEAPAEPDRGRPAAAGQGVRRRRRPRHAGRPRAGRPARRDRGGRGRGGVGVRRRHRLRRAVRRARPARRGPGRRHRASTATATARSSAGTRRWWRRRRRPA